MFNTSDGHLVVVPVCKSSRGAVITGGLYRGSKFIPITIPVHMKRHRRNYTQTAKSAIFDHFPKNFSERCCPTPKILEDT